MTRELGPLLAPRRQNMLLDLGSIAVVFCSYDFLQMT